METIEQITIANRGDLVVSQKSQKTYFSIDDADKRRFICFVPSLYNELPDGATVLVKIRLGRTEADTPSITGMATQSDIASAGEIDHPTEKPIEIGTSIEQQVAVKEIGECWRIGKLSDDDLLVLAYKGWLSKRVNSIAQAYKEAKDELNRQSSGRDEQPDRPDTDSETSGQLPSKEDRTAQLSRIQKLAKDAGYNKKFAEAKLKTMFGKTTLPQLSQEELNTLEEQLKKEAK